MSQGKGAMRRGPQLLTYPDSLGGSIRAIGSLLRGRLAGHFTGVHILPPFPSSGDRGFAPIDYRRIEPAFGDWSDISDLARDHDVMLDLMVNHISRRSPQFRDFEQHGRGSAFADLFITLDKVWPNGDPPAEDVARIFLRKPDDPFSRHQHLRHGQDGADLDDLRLPWASRADRPRPGIDNDAPAHRGLVRVVRRLMVSASCGSTPSATWSRSPAAAASWWSRRSTRCSTGSWRRLPNIDIEVLPEVHDRQATHQKLSARGYWTYDFVLPGLLLGAFQSGDAARLADHLARSPQRQFTTLDCHDGIPVRPDLDDILEPAEMTALADEITARGGNINRILGDRAGGVDVHQLNCTYYSALGADDGRYLAARAIQLFARGVPQLYYVGLLAGENDHAAVQRTGDGRAVNRHDYSAAEIEAALERPVVRRILELVRLRREHPAFEGDLAVTLEDSARLRLAWSHGPDAVELLVDLKRGESWVSS